MYTGTGALAFTLGGTVPALGEQLFAGVSGNKTVTVQVPDNDAWSGIIGSYSGINTGDTWGNAFRGKGWNEEDGYLTGTANTNISLTIQTEDTP
jgi:hypothetical protein